jgi:DNA-binding transcriptional LysR family regulator
VIFDAALSISRRSSEVSLNVAAPMFSSRRFSFVVPGIGTIHGFWASSLGDLLDVLGSAIEACLLSVDELEAELGRDHDLAAERCKCLAHELFVGEWAVDLCRVEKRNALRDGRADDVDHLLLVGRWPVAKAHAHAAEAERRHFQSTLSQFSLLLRLLTLPEELALLHIARDRLKRVLEDWCRPFSGYHLYYASQRQSSPAFAPLVDALRYRS